MIGFQKVTKYDFTDWNQWLDNDLPAFVEGSDPKKIGEIGKGEKSYIKIGDYNFEAVKFALQNKKYRVTKSKKPKISNSISFTAIPQKKSKKKEEKSTVFGTHSPFQVQSILRNFLRILFVC